MVFTGEDVIAGQHVFQKYGLMQFGTIFGHGAYLGPDFTAQYLHKASQAMVAFYAQGKEPSADVVARVQQEFKRNAYQPQTNKLEFSSGQAHAFAQLVDFYADYFGPRRQQEGLKRPQIHDPTEVRQLTAYFAWASWAAATTRPGTDYSYTNNWPPDAQRRQRADGRCLPLERTEPDCAAGRGRAGALRRGPLRLAGLAQQRAGGAGTAAEVPAPRRSPPHSGSAGHGLVLPGRGGPVPCTRPVGRGQRPLPRRAGRLLRPVDRPVAALQPHADVARATGPVLRGHELSGDGHLHRPDDRRPRATPPGRSWPSPCSARWCWSSWEACSARRPASTAIMPGGLWFWWIGDQGWEYLDLGRLWQILLVVGMGLWVVILLRGMWSRLRGEHPGNMPYLFLYSALSIPLFYAAGLAFGCAGQLRRDGLLAILGRPPLGRGFPGTVHHDHGGLHLRAAGRGPHRHRHAHRLPRHHPLLDRRRDRHDAPRLFQRRPGIVHGAGGVLLGDGSDSAAAADVRGVAVHAAGRPGPDRPRCSTRQPRSSRTSGP